MRARTVVVAALALAVVAGIGFAATKLFHTDLPLPLMKACEVRGSDRALVSLAPEQLANGATIAAVGLRRRLPERAVVVALATAFQESKLRNLDGGDRDSIGLFQQRPSQGWGRPDQLSDPRYAAAKFYDHLVKVPGWRGMSITEAAQAVQRSAHPAAYEKWADEAAVLTNAFSGLTPGAVACTLSSDSKVRGEAATASLTESLRLEWGKVELTSPTGANPTGVALQVPDDKVGWRYAHWLVAHAEQHGIKRVRHAGQEWTAERGTWARTSTGGAAKAVDADGVVAEVYAAA